MLFLQEISKLGPWEWAGLTGAALLLVVALNAFFSMARLTVGAACGALLFATSYSTIIAAWAFADPARLFLAVAACLLGPFSFYVATDFLVPRQSERKPHYGLGMFFAALFLFCAGTSVTLDYTRQNAVHVGGGDATERVAESKQTRAQHAAALADARAALNADKGALRDLRARWTEQNAAVEAEAANVRCGPECLRKKAALDAIGQQVADAEDAVASSQRAVDRLDAAAPSSDGEPTAQDQFSRGFAQAFGDGGAARQGDSLFTALFLAFGMMTPGLIFRAPMFDTDRGGWLVRLNRRRRFARTRAEWEHRAHPLINAEAHRLFAEWKEAHAEAAANAKSEAVEAVMASVGEGGAILNREALEAMRAENIDQWSAAMLRLPAAHSRGVQAVLCGADPAEHVNALRLLGEAWMEESVMSRAVA